MAVLLPALTAAGTGMVDIGGMFAKAREDGRVGLARKSAVVDARKAVVGEQIVTIIAGEGKETQSKLAEAGDMVVRNRCEATGNEEYLVGASTFSKRYEGPLDDRGDGSWRPYRPRGPEMQYFIVRDQDGSFVFNAPWGEAMVGRPGDAIVRNPSEPTDTYRVAQNAFKCTYEVVKRPDGGR